MQNIRINLYDDWIKLLRGELNKSGYKDKSYGDKEVSQIYLNRQKRLISQKPRKILKPLKFQCPDEVKEGLRILENAISKGQDLTPHLSEKIRSPKYNDYLLNDWGIHHLHLGTTIRPNGFIEREGPLLFCRFDESTAYLISIQPHGSWVEQDMIRVLHENWPESIAQFRVNGIVGLTKSISDQDVKTLRDKNANTLVEIEDGTVYGPIGGGYASSGISIEVVIQADQYEIWLNEAQEYIINNIDTIKNDMRRKSINLPSGLSFRLKVVDNKIYAVEDTTSLSIDLRLEHY